MKSNLTIVGFGIVGAMIADTLSDYIDDITIIYKYDDKKSASYHSFAWINAFDKSPNHYNKLNLDSMHLWHELYNKNLVSDDEIKFGGDLRLYKNSNKIDYLYKLINSETNHGIQFLDIDEIKDIENNLALDIFNFAVQSKYDGWVETITLINKIKQKLKVKKNIKFINAEIKNVISKNNNVIHLELDDDNNTKITSELYLFAAGFQTSKLASMMNIYLPQIISPGIVISTKPATKVLNKYSSLNLITENDIPHIHFRQNHDGEIICGIGSQDDSQFINPKQFTAKLHDELSKYLNNKIVYSGYKYGLRVMPKDGLPIIGLYENSNVYIVMTHSGVTLAPILSNIIKTEIVDKEHVSEIDFYRINRFYK
tara:strand:+ start:751 stop:1857 length:1107 start_codon:yes stop_codon:yes gene_type:complete